MNETDDKLHIIISGERGRVIRIPCSKKKMIFWGVTAFSFLLCASIIFVGTIFFSVDRKGFLTQKILPAITSQKSPQLTHPRKEQELSKQQSEQLQKLYTTISSLKKENQQQRAYFEQEKELLLGDTMEELNSRSKQMEKLFQSIGIIVPKKTKIRLHSNENSGGVFREVPPLEAQKDELINRIDSYMEKAEAIPLGKPVKGRITSPFGKRRDPLNGRVSFHDGIDIKGQRGDKIYATADGVVTFAGRLGGYGNYLELKHKDGYETAYAHMHKLLAKKGQKIKRGDVIGLVGNTGRSTGSHLHYEIKRNEKLLNPAKYMEVATTMKKAAKKKRK